MDIRAKWKARQTSESMKVTDIKRFVLNIPFENPRVDRHMHRAVTGHWERVNVWRMETDTGIVGYGEGWGDEAGAARAKGRNPLEILDDDSVNQGIQIAAYDVAGKAEGLPAYRLLGYKVRDACPIGWWAIDMPSEDWAEEVKRASQLGYTSAKLKARPWRDIIDQIDVISQVVPRDFTFAIDFNGFLLNAGNAIPILQELELNEHVALFETPIPQEDIEGYRQIRSRITKSVGIHYGVPPIWTALREEMCDGFVMHEGPTAKVMMLRDAAAVAEMANKPFWLQMVGTGIMTAFTVHLGAVLSHAQWPAVTCHELWADDLLKERLDVKYGYITVPEKPGLGVEVDEAALERYRVEPQASTPKDEYLRKHRVLKIRWPPAPGQKQGPARCFTSEPDYQRAFYSGSLPLFVRGVTLEVLEDDGTQAFTQLYERVKQGGAKGVWE